MRRPKRGVPAKLHLSKKVFLSTFDCSCYNTGIVVRQAKRASAGSGGESAKKPEIVQAVLRACRVMNAFRHEGELLRLRDLVARTSENKATVLRLLRTLEQGGFVERVGKEHYRSRISTPNAPKARIGFATRGSRLPFSRIVTESVQRAAAEAGFDLVTVINHRSPKKALSNADLLVREGVELVIEFQTHERVAPVISSRFLEANIPVIAIEIPHPGATFFGANNYQAGLIGGRALGRWIQKHWGGRVERVFLLEEEIAGPLPKLRVTGMRVGMHQVLPETEQATIVEVDGKGTLETAFEQMRRRLRLLRPERTVVAAGNDPMALGALRALEEAGWLDYCAVMGQNATPEARAELRRPGTRLVGSVAYFPERYGDEIMALARRILDGKPVPPAVFTKHRLITPENVDKYYPLDAEPFASFVG